MYQYTHEYLVLSNPLIHQLKITQMQMLHLFGAYYGLVKCLLINVYGIILENRTSRLQLLKLADQFVTRHGNLASTVLTTMPILLQILDTMTVVQQNLIYQQYIIGKRMATTLLLPANMGIVNNGKICLIWIRTIKKQLLIYDSIVIYQY